MPHDVDSPSFKASIGTVTYLPDRNAIVVDQAVQRLREYLMRAHFGLPSISAEDTGRGRRRRGQFEIPYFTVSGIQVRYLKIIEKSGPGAPGCGTSQNGDYQA